MPGLPWIVSIVVIQVLISCFGLSESAAPPDSLSQLGCYSHVRGGRLLSGHSQTLARNTPQKCKTLCFQKGFLYSGVGYGGECFCGDAHPRLVSLKSSALCSIVCPGDSTLKCGGNGFVNAYDTGITDLPVLGMKLGCFDDEGARILGGFKVDLEVTNSARRCTNLCRSLGYHYAGTEYGYECFCGNTVNTNSSRDSSDDECNKSCPGDEFETCGANWELMVYRTGLSDPEPVMASLGCFTFTGSSPLKGYGQDLGEATNADQCSKLCFFKGFLYSTVIDRTRCWCDVERPDKLLATDDRNCASAQAGLSQADTDSYATVYRTNFTVVQVSHRDKYIGCFHSNNSNSLGGFLQKFEKQLTPEKCLYFCFIKGYLFSATKKKNECHCGDNKPSDKLVKVSDEECSLPCPGDRFENCGGRDHLNVYWTGITEEPVAGKHIGCYVDESWPRVLDGHKTDLDSTNSPQRCLNYCSRLGFKFAGVEYQKECFCGNSRPQSTLNAPDNQCDSVCTGDNSQTCGGGWRMAVYSAEGAITGSVTDKPPSREPGPSEDCESSETLVNGKPMCRGAVIFQDSFSTASIAKHWKHEVKIADAPDYEFVTFTSDSKNSFQKDGKLVIKPTLLSDREVQEGSISLNGSCTGLAGTRECQLTSFSYNILPPVQTARLHTRKSFSFRYGIVEIRARLPAGDWLVPELWLLPKDQSYGINYLSGKVRIAMSRGNRYLTHNGRDISSSTLESGVLVGTDQDVIARSIDNRMTGSWHSIPHNYTLIWTPDNLLFYVDGQSQQALLPPSVKLTELMGFKHSDNSSWTTGSRIAPFDTDFYLSLGLSAGGMRDFPDGSMSKDMKKPWTNFKLKACLNFWLNMNTWKPSWDEEKSSLIVEHVQVTAL